MEIKETCYKGTRILLGNKKRDLIDKMIEILKKEEFQEISIPIIQYQEYFKEKVGEENNNLMYNFTDRGNRELCLAPEYTSIMMELAKTTFKYQKDVKLFYVQECFRGEKPQAGRYRQFTQLGVEILNPTSFSGLPELAYKLILQTIPRETYGWLDTNIKINREATRGLDYYKEGKGFEITCDSLGSSKQICGGGEYKNGVGFALGIDRILNIK